LTYYWADTEQQTILDSRDDVLNQCFNFIENAMKLGEAVLIHSIRGQSRCICIVAG